MTATDRAETRRLLLGWYDERHRDLPWRRDAHPYRVWVSEVMLQQTRAAAVVPYFERWMDRFPTLEDLARADEQEVLEIWSGLGYYARARNLHRAARIVRERHDGEIPNDAAALCALPGIGEYTMGAILSIAFGKRAAAIDGNARRVLCRLFGLASPSPTLLRRRAMALVDPDRAGDFNQALMELGATICAPRAPRCTACPLVEGCRSHASGKQGQWPRPRRRGRLPTFRVGTAVVVSSEGRVLLARRPPHGLLGGLWEFPGALVRDHEEPMVAARRALSAALGPDTRAEAVAGTIAPVRHAYSHRRHEYHPFRFLFATSEGVDPPGRAASGEASLDRAPGEAPPGIAVWTGTAWFEPAGLGGLPLPAAQRRIAAEAVPDRGREGTGC